MENRSTREASAPIELRLRRRFDAPVERVWRAWTDPQALMRWFGPAETRRVLRAETDVRVGGAYQVGFSTEDGLEHHASGYYREVEPLRRLVFTWAWRDTPAEVSMITLEFTSADGGTELHFTGRTEPLRLSGSPEEVARVLEDSLPEPPSDPTLALVS